MKTDHVYLLRLESCSERDPTESITAHIDTYTHADPSLEQGKDASARLLRRIQRGLCLDAVQTEWLEAELNRFFKADFE